jgi:hypothetical protein
MSILHLYDVAAELLDNHVSTIYNTDAHYLISEWTFTWSTTMFTKKKVISWEP